MEFLAPFFLFLLGLSVGSFLNVLIYRLPQGLPISGRSFCPQCKHKLAWFDNIPLLSFAWLRGECQYCGRRISWQYPVVELTTGILFVMVWWWLKNWCGSLLHCSIVLLFHCSIIASLIAIFVSDLKYQIIPDQVVYPAIGVTLIYRLFFSSVHLAGVRAHTSEVSLWGPLLTSLGAMGFFLFLHLVTKGKGMGLGDVKLAFLMGLLLGWPKIVVAFYFAFLTGAVIGVILILLGKKKFGQHIPFGPFLVGGTFVAWFWGEKVLSYLGYL